ADLVRPGSLVALGDGIGSPRAVTAELCEAARSAGGVRLLLGWTPVADPALDFTAFADARTVMSGWGLRRPVDAGLVRGLPVRLSAVPALLHGPLRPDLLVAAVVPRPGGGFGFGAEVSWLRAAVAAGAVVAGVLAPRYPRCDGGPALPEDRLVIVGSTDDRPATLAFSPPQPEHRVIAEPVPAPGPAGGPAGRGGRPRSPPGAPGLRPAAAGAPGDRRARRRPGPGGGRGAGRAGGAGRRDPGRARGAGADRVGPAARGRRRPRPP